MDIVHTHQCPELKTFINNLGKGNNYREINGKFGVIASTAYEKVNTTDTDENVFSRLVPVPGHVAQISARAPTKGYVQTSARAQAPGRGTKSEQGLSND